VAIETVLVGEKKRRTLANTLKSCRPYPKQKLFHDLGQTCTERLLRAGNQLGKTWAGAMEMATHLSALGVHRATHVRISYSIVHQDGCIRAVYATV
jgi:hypothetical protein